MKNVNVAVVDQTSFALGLNLLLSQSDKFNLKYSFNTYNDLRIFIKKNHYKFSREIDMIVMNCTISSEKSDMALFAEFRRIKNLTPDCKIIGILDAFDPREIFSLIKYGAKGLIEMNIAPKEILECMETVSSGNQFFTSGIVNKIFEQFSINENMILTVREIIILEHLASGYTYNIIAEKSSINVQTVKTHVRNIYGKLNVRSKMEALKVARAKKLIYEI